MDYSQIAVAFALWVVFAGWLSHLFWIYQHRALIVPMNIQLATLAALVIAAYNVERTLRRRVPWLFVSSFFLLLADVMFGALASSCSALSLTPRAALDELISRVPFASALIPLVYYTAQIIAAVGVLLLPSQVRRRLLRWRSFVVVDCRTNNRIRLPQGLDD